MSQSLTTRTLSLSRVLAISGFISGVVLIVNGLKRAEIIPLTPFTQLVAPLAQLLAVGLIIGIFAATPALRNRLGSVGVILYVGALISLVGVEYVINLVFPYVDPAIRAEVVAGPLGVALTVVSISFLLGTLLFFGAFWRVAGSPKVAIILSVISTVPIALRMSFPEIVLDLGLIGLGVGVALLATWLLRSARSNAAIA